MSPNTFAVTEFYAGQVKIIKVSALEELAMKADWDSGPSSADNTTTLLTKIQRHQKVLDGLSEEFWPTRWTGTRWDAQSRRSSASSVTFRTASTTRSAVFATARP